MSNKTSASVAKAFLKIYARKKLKFPNTLIVDPGKEFMGDVTKLLEKNKVHIQRSEAKNHRAQAIVERANRTLSEKLFSHQYAQELLMDDKSRVWVNRLRGVLKVLNSEVKRLTGKEPVKAIAMKEVGDKKIDYKRPVGHKEVLLPPGVQVRYLLAPGEYEGGDKRRATDPIWSIRHF